VRFERCSFQWPRSIISLTTRESILRFMRLGLRAHVQTTGYAACALAGALWGTGFFFGKVAFSQLRVGHFVLYRFLFACAGMLPIMRTPHFSQREWKLLLAASFFGIPLQFMIQFYGLKLTTVSHAALMVGTMPVILALGATVFTHERLDPKGWLALVGSTAGVALIVVSGVHGIIGGGNLWGDLLVIASLFVALAWVLLNRHLMALGQSPLSVTSWGLLSGTAMLGVWVFLTSGPPRVHGISVRVWLAVAASGLLSTAVSTLLWNWGIHRVPASRAGVFLNLEPALGSILGVALLGDHLGPDAWAGGVLIIAAAVVVTTGTPEAEQMQPKARD
jgi:drug/metabolite transporter (DMT)-like permease